MTNESKRDMWYGIGAVVIIALIVWAVVANNNKKSDTMAPAANNPTATTPPAATTGEDQTPAAPAKLSYTDALKIYGQTGNNRRYQVTAGCLVTPGTMSLKTGDKFMLDNRDAVAHTVMVGTRSYSLGKYGFAIVSDSTVGPADIKCDNTYRAKINIEK